MDNCKKVGAEYCAVPEFASRCKKTCNICLSEGIVEKPCMDKFSQFTCGRYRSYGWCDRKDTRDAIRLQCPASCGVCGKPTTTPKPITTPKPLERSSTLSLTAGRGVWL